MNSLEEKDGVKQRTTKRQSSSGKGMAKAAGSHTQRKASRYSDDEEYEHFPDVDDSLDGEIVDRERKKEKGELRSTEQRAIPGAYVPTPDALSMLSHQSERRVTRATIRDQIPPRDLSPETMNDAEPVAKSDSQVTKSYLQFLHTMLPEGQYRNFDYLQGCERMYQHAKLQKEERSRGLAGRPPAGQNDFTIRNAPGSGAMEFEPHVKSPDNAHKAEVDDEVTAVVNKAALSDHISIIVIGDHGEDRLLFFEVDTLRYMDCGSDMDAEDLGDQVEVEQDSDRAIEIMDRLLLAPAQLGKSSCSP